MIYAKWLFLVFHFIASAWDSLLKFVTAYFYGNPGERNGRVPREKKGRMLQEGKQHETEKNNQWWKKMYHNSFQKRLDLHRENSTRE